MNTAYSKAAFGDFQTPSDLAADICGLISASVKPKTIVEPTCGIGNFVQAAGHFFACAQNIYGYEINGSYALEAQARLNGQANAHISCQDFFSFDWKEELSRHDAPLLILGNLPWVTSSAQGAINANNLPQKSNFLKFKGIDAITGKANFDISEWMLISLIESAQKTKVDIAILIKTIVARKALSYIQKNNICLSRASIYNIDAKKYFGASVDSCLFHIKLNHSETVSAVCDVFDGLNAKNSDKIYIKGGEIRKNIQSCPHTSSPQKWRSGIKHDAARVMELAMLNNDLVNGFGEVVKIEEKYLFPLLKGSDVANKRNSNRWVIVPQFSIGEDTGIIKRTAPMTWEYLNRFSGILDNRKSVIYQKNPRFSIFGVGDYAFKKWKIAICGLYKKLSFNIVAPIHNKPCMFDDTTYFLSFDSKDEALQVYDAVTSQEAIDFFNSLIFWDEKRPIKTSILNKFDWSLPKPSPEQAGKRLLFHS